MPRTPRVVSGSFGLPLGNEKSRDHGEGGAAEEGDRESAAASAVPTNSPAAHVPLMWLRRWPGVTPNTPSISRTT